MPILTAGAAEYWAWGHISSAVTTVSRPVFEVVPTDNPENDLVKFTTNIVPISFQSAVLTVDTGRFDQTKHVAGFGFGPVLWIAQELYTKAILAKPVVRLEDDASVLADATAAANLHGQGICLRLGSSDKVPDVTDVSNRWPRISNVTGLPSNEVDLLIDFGTIERSHQIAPSVKIATSLLGWARQTGPWRRIAIAVGAFPSSLRALPCGAATSIRRYEAVLFARVVTNNPPIIPDFGDYGVRSPTRVSGVGRPTHPNLRYTSGLEWQVFREDRSGLSSGAIRALCSNVMGSSHWPVTGSRYSAGDAEIDRHAHSVNGGRLPTYWLRWSASHHFEHIADRLASLGIP